MATEFVRAQVGGQTVGGWKTVSIHAALNHAARSFQLSAAFEAGASATHRLFELYAPIKIYASPVEDALGDLVFTGHIFVRRPRVGPAYKDLTISGRSRGAQAIDCSHRHKTGRFANMTPLAIAQELDDLGVGFRSDLTLDKIERAQAQPGASIFREVERHGRDAGITLTGAAEGGVDLLRPGVKAPRAGALIGGVNIREATAEHNGENRHSEVRLRGQKVAGHGRAATQIEAVARDRAVTLTRPLVLHHDGETDIGRLKKRAEAHRDRAAGASLKAQATIQGWRDDQGKLYAPGQKVWVEDEWLDIRQDMLVESVNYAQGPGSSNAQGTGEGGTYAHLDLIDPRAYGGEKGKGAKSGKGWDIDDGKAVEE